MITQELLTSASDKVKTSGEYRLGYLYAPFVINFLDWFLDKMDNEKDPVIIALGDGLPINYVLDKVAGINPEKYGALKKRAQCAWLTRKTTAPLVGQMSWEQEDKQKVIDYMAQFGLKEDKPFYFLDTGYLGTISALFESNGYVPRTHYMLSGVQKFPGMINDIFNIGQRRGMNFVHTKDETLSRMNHFVGLLSAVSGVPDMAKNFNAFDAVEWDKLKYNLMYFIERMPRDKFATGELVRKDGLIVPVLEDHDEKGRRSSSETAIKSFYRGIDTFVDKHKNSILSGKIMPAEFLYSMIVANGMIKDNDIVMRNIPDERSLEKIVCATR